MHRVNTKQRRIVFFRFLTYGFTLALTIVTTVLLLYLALGYRLGSSGHVVRNGLLLVDNRPQSAEVRVDGVVKDTRAPSRFVLPAGSYDLSLRLEGYHDWSKRVSVSASKVRDVNYPLLIPTDLSRRELITLTSPDVVSQSPDRKRMLVYSSTDSHLQLLDLDPQDLKSTELALGNAVRREAGKLGQLSVIEWALDGRHVLLEQTLPSGVKHLLSVDVTKPDQALNISNVYGDQVPEAVHYAGSNTDQVYGIKNGVLSRYNITDASSVVLMQNIQSYVPYGDDVVLFARQLDDGVLQVGIWQDQKAVVIEQTTQEAGTPILQYGQYDEHYYFIVAYRNKDTITLYRDPLTNPILSKYVPFVTLTFAQPQKIELSGSNEFLMAQNGKNIMVYDFEDIKQYRYALPFEPAATTVTKWIDDHRLQTITAENQSVLYEYDGTNQHTLAAVRAGSQLYYSNNYQHFYNLKDSSSTISFGVTSLVVGEE